MANINTIIFDLDQTLIDRKATFCHFLKQQYSSFQSEMNAVDIEKYMQEILKFDNNGYTEKSIVYKKACDELNLTVAPSDLLNDFCQNYGQNPFLFNGVKDLLLSLQGKYRLGLVTNGRSTTQQAKITNSGIATFFSSIKISQEVGVKKPDPLIFKECIDELGVEAASCVFVGDHPVNDVEAALSFGMKAIWVNNGDYADPEKCDAMINSVLELDNVLSGF